MLNWPTKKASCNPISNSHDIPDSPRPNIASFSIANIRCKDRKYFINWFVKCKGVSGKKIVQKENPLFEGKFQSKTSI